jgi:hypothetical protein
MGDPELLDQFRPGAHIDSKCAASLSYYAAQPPCGSFLGYEEKMAHISIQLDIHEALSETVSLT